MPATVEALRTLVKITKACEAATGSITTYVIGPVPYTFSVDVDSSGGIRGVIQSNVTGFSWQRAGSYYIDPKGNLVRGSDFMKAAVQL